MKNISKIYNNLSGDSLYRNSIYLMASTAVMAVFGFFFWIINARLFTTEQVGLGTTLISVLSLISSISLMGLNIGIIKYLPTSNRKTEKINTSFTLVGIVSLIASLIFILGLETFSPKLLFLRDNPFYTLLFIAFAIFSSSNTLIESVFIAFRSTGYVLIKNIIFSLGKLILSFLLISLGAMAIFISFSGAIAIAFLLALIFLVKQFGYKFKLSLDTGIIANMAKYSTANYFAGVIGTLPQMLLPIIITNKISPQQSAFFYMDMMIANLIFVIPQAITQSLFAEGSYKESEFNTNIKKAVKITTLLIAPTILLTILFGNRVLLAFGKEYSSEGFRFLQLISLSGILISINSIYGTILRVKHRIAEIITVSILESSVVLILAYFLLGKGLYGIGIAWIVGRTISCVYLAIVNRKK
ncbi:hypothetical protein A2Z22_05305 [Candidatus Woesebacteria bacterium RBG_16_34_12]|uniref:Polysaccharide biosynthesis protein C-terminal domain-containing protein n=1 Tax=Candidatus Woesebacteria bacterium RBG_16_34_12 TaxID=1802480 RepID=A0A1F7X8P7_9BACT|nr:MAG: hypothetical protein A2Z22_05305 [Candidatus Woesebacteria bacterium RBG_16_34_12]